MSADVPTADAITAVHGEGQEEAIRWLAVGLFGDDMFHGATPDGVVRGIEMATASGFPALVQARRDGIGSALCDVARGVVGGSLARFLRREDLAGQPHPSSWPSEIVNPAGLSAKILEAAVGGAARRLLNPDGQRIEEPVLIEVRLIGAALLSQERWGHAEQEEPEHFTGAFLSREEAVDDGYSTYEGPFYVIKGRAPRAADLVDSCIADDIFERMIDHVSGNFGFEQGEAFASAEPTEEAKAELVALVKAWANRHVPIGFWNGTGNPERIENGGDGEQQDG